MSSNPNDKFQFFSGTGTIFLMSHKLAPTYYQEKAMVYQLPNHHVMLIYNKG